MACNKVALVVSSISKHCVCPNPLLPSEGLSRGEDIGGGTKPFRGEEGDRTKPFGGKEGVGTKPF